jgi:hypothetical protein
VTFVDYPIGPHRCVIPDDFQREEDGGFRCVTCRELWCECCTQNGRYCRHRCPSHPKPSEPASAWFGKPYVNPPAGSYETWR